MNQRERSTRLGMEGDDVALLQYQLGILGADVSADRPGTLGVATARAVREFQRGQELEATGVFDAATARQLEVVVAALDHKRFVVRGQVRIPDGAPLARVIVEVRRKRLRDEVSVGRAQTDREGRYSVEYDAGRDAASLVLRVTDRDGAELTTSQVGAPPRPLEIVDLTVGGEFRGPSEFALLEASLTATLNAQGVQAADLDAEDIEVLHDEHGLDPNQIAVYAASARMARESGIRHETLYGLVRQGLPANLLALTAEPEEAVQRALVAAANKNKVSASLGESQASTTTLADLRSQRVRLVMREPETDGVTLGTLIGLAGISRQRGERLLTTYVNRKGSVSDFWRELRSGSGLPAAQINSLQYLVGAAAFTLNHQPLVAELFRRRRSGETGPGLRDLASFSRADWRELIDTGGGDGEPLGAPAFLGEDEEQRRGRYAAFLANVVEATFPTAVLTHRLAEPGHEMLSPVVRFLERNPEFEFQTQTISEFAREHPAAVGGDGDGSAVLVQLKAVQRLFAIAPPFNKVATVALIERGITSAVAIRRMGAPQFIRLHSEALGGDMTAQQVYNRAALRADTALYQLSLTAVFNPTPLAIMAPHLLGQGIPDLEDLFGALDACRCEHCGSVYGPAAYLVDLLHFLMNRPAVPHGRTALDVLYGRNRGSDANPRYDRRGDIGDLELSCHNTETELPYIDIVNEVLEGVIAGDGVIPLQTQSDAISLGANPEHLNEAAYLRVAGAVYPWGLPFDLWQEEAARYLALMGVPRHALMQRFHGPDAQQSVVDLACAQLGITPRERAVITGAAGETLGELWGLEPFELTRLLDHRSAATVLERSDLTYEELTAMLGVPFIRRGAALAVDFEGTDCDIETATIDNLANSVLTRFHRFVRLQRKLSWSIPELGKTLATLGATQINDGVLVQIAQVERLRRDLDIPLETVLAWCTERLDTRVEEGRPSLYEKVFLDPTVNRPELEVFELNVARTELRDVGEALSDQATVVHGALGIDAADLERLVSGELEDDRLNLANLTRLFQVVSLTKALRLSVEDYLLLRRLSGFDPFEGDGPASTVQFVEVAENVRESGFSLPLLGYLILHEATPAPGIPSEDRTGLFLARLQAGLGDIRTAHAFAPDSTGEQTFARLAELLPLELATKAIAIVGGTSVQDVAGQSQVIEEAFSTFLDPAEALERLVNPGSLTAAEDRYGFVLQPLLNHLIANLSERLVVESFASNLGVESEVAGRLLGDLVRSPQDETTPVIIDFLADDFAGGGSGGSGVNAPAPLAPDQFPGAFAACHRLTKAGIVLAFLLIPASHVDAYFTRSTAAGWLAPNALPLETVKSPGDGLATSMRTASVFRAAATMPQGSAALLDLLGSLDDPEQTREGFLALLASHTGWSAADLAFLTGPDAFDIDYPEGFRDGIALVDLKHCFALLGLLGVSASVAAGWSIPQVDAGIARMIKQSARAHFPDQAAWLAAARPVRDELRELQRSALVGFLLHELRIDLPQFETPHPQLARGARRDAVKELQVKLNFAGAHPALIIDGIFGPLTEAAVIEFQTTSGLDADGIVGSPTWTALDLVPRRLRGPSDLYAHFLLDVEMDACMLTSRLVQATNSVQLFVQRCLLNLEPEVELTAEDAKEWEWMKYYRVWEANRKVFLYPENWIEPELRDDKTPFFVEMERGLLQDEMAEPAVEREFLSYLASLDQVAQMEVCGLHREADGDSEVLHVIARTRHFPHTYYYRRWVDQRYWTAWDPIDVAIAGNHLVPLVWNRRLYLFWPSFQPMAEEPIKDEETPKRYYQIRLENSEYHNGKWSPKRQSEVMAETSRSSVLPETDRFSFWAQFDPQDRLHVLFGMHSDEEGERGTVIAAQFRLADASGTFIVVPSSTAWQILTPFPGTQGEANSLRSAGAQPLTAITSGEVVDLMPFPFVLITVLSTSSIETAEVLGSGRLFRLMLPNHQRLFVSQAPFFYQDEKRTFFVVPQGSYTGGPEGGLSGSLTLELRPIDASPLEIGENVLSLAAGQFRLAGGTETGVAPARPLAATLPTGSEPQMVSIVDLVSLLAPRSSTAQGVSPKQWQAERFRFESFYHPFVSLLVEQLVKDGIQGIFRPDPEKERTHAGRARVRDLRRQALQLEFFSEYGPNENRVLNLLDLKPNDPVTPLDEFDFSYSGSYSTYNWEIFFHAPFLIAKQLSANKRFAEAQRWFHYIFDPTHTLSMEETADEPWPERVWQSKPFFLHGTGESIATAMLLLRSGGLSSAERMRRQQLLYGIEAWRKSPFNPHLIARIRPEAYMKSVVMAYLDNLIAWGDHLFRQDTRESINEATQIYLLAAEILGERPPEIAAHEDARRTIDGEEVSTFNQLRGHLDDFSNALVELETTIFPMDGDSPGIGSIVAASSLVTMAGGGGGGIAPDLSLTGTAAPAPPPGLAFDLALATPIPAVLGPALFFCIPKNDKLLSYWDTVADRLFKIRHCMNIEGVERKLALFQPPIDPALLVKAAAAGLDISSVVSELNASPSPYRFQTLAQKARDTLNEVQALGSALLSVLEKRDAEELALLRAGQEIQLLNTRRSLKLEAIEEAKVQHVALMRQQDVAVGRRDYYQSRLFLNLLELAQLFAQVQAQDALVSARDQNEAAATTVAFHPDISLTSSIGFPLAVSFSVGATVGGTLKSVFERLKAATYEESATRLAGNVAILSALAGYGRRFEDWIFQGQTAAAEITAIEKQIEAAVIRWGIAERDLASHDLETRNAEAVDDYLRTKYTNTTLYTWMVQRISDVYFQSYDIAYQLSKRAERSFQHELGVTDTEFIRPGSWDSLKKGLLAAETLKTSVLRMEAAYLDQNKREYELTKHVSLALLDPVALLMLRETGQCFVNLPEAIFDLDFPGHYLRRIKSVSLSLPCVAGPYTGVSCTLTLLNNRVRTDATASAVYAYQGQDDLRFRHNTGAVQSIATSNGQNDAGLFELSYRDERYLPFEGAGAISGWRLQLPSEFRQFDYDTISDVILHMRYTARPGGSALQQAATASLQEDSLNTLPLGQNGERTGLFRFFSARREFSSEWHRFLHPQEGSPHRLQIDVSHGRLPYWMQALPLRVTAADVYLKLSEGAAYDDADPATLTFARTADGPLVSDAQLIRPGSLFEGQPHVRLESWPEDGLGAWVITAPQHAALEDRIAEDLWIILELAI